MERVGGGGGRGREAILVELDGILVAVFIRSYVSVFNNEGELLDLSESEVRVEMALEPGILGERGRREGGRGELVVLVSTTIRKLKRPARRRRLPLSHRKACGYS